MYLLDTNVCIRILNDASASIAARLARHQPWEIFLCSVVKAELYYGARHSQRIEENLALLSTFFAPFMTLPFDDRAADEYGKIRSELARKGTPIGPNDLMIAAIARCRNLILVTHNYREFNRVDQLSIEDWSEEST